MVEQDIKANILAVDDNPDNLLAIEATLVSLGQRLVKVRSGAEALRQLLVEDFAVILMDVQMPDMDGFETAALIRQRPRTRHTPIIFLTAIHRSEVNVARGYELGGVDYLFKPIVPEILRAKVSVFVELHRMNLEVKRQSQRLREIEQREMQMRLAEMEERNREIQAASRLKSEFLANMSHELRTPLNAIIGFSQLLYDGEIPVSEAKGKEYLGYVLNSALHLLQLINDVLDLVKVESGKMEFKPETVDTCELAREVVDIVRSMATRKRIHVSFDVHDEVRELFLDPGKLKQVLYNYLSNAIKFSPDGGQVLLRVLPEGAANFRVEVEDFGIGIRKEDLTRLFVEFEQLDNGAAKNYPGTGLGLALTKRIVEAQSGRVGVKSRFGKGSTFLAVLPREMKVTANDQLLRLPPHEFEGAAEEAVAPATEAGPRILIVDNRASEREWASQTLRESGYRIDVASSAHDALELVRAHRYDAITLGLELPDQSSWGLLHLLREEEDTRAVPAILAWVPDNGHKPGVHDFVVRPGHSDELLRSLRQAGVPPDPTRVILVIDDDEKARLLFDEILTRSGFIPVVRSNVQDGLTAAELHDPAAVVLDLMMPDVDGFQFLTKLRKSDYGSETPVIVCTAKELTKKERNRLQHLAQGVVLKGSGPDVLVEQLQRVVPNAPGANVPAVRSREETARVQRPSHRILIVDDNHVNLELTRVLFESDGYDVRVAPDADEAQVVIADFKPELILMDLQLPGMNGYDLTRQLKADASTHQIIILAYTASAMKGDYEKALEAGCDGYVAKPIDTRKLRGMVSRYLERQEAVVD
jgi:CheY-like chemotaxis protein